MQANNSRAGFSDTLTPVPLPNGNAPTSFPTTLAHLVVGGSEFAPQTTNVSSWSREDSLKTILLYEPDYESEAEGAGIGPVDKNARSSRRRRLYLARLIGVTTGQMCLVAQASFMAP